ncbi:hypothetical protein V6N12_028459 [Hibiscus sabdariffa]|uniref:Uncharacterized protein n=1 Tax=Hibiscus sabdariffa TaxID=183260 RepID=A0ABR2F5W8_9ROSI
MTESFLGRSEDLTAFGYCGPDLDHGGSVYPPESGKRGYNTSPESESLEPPLGYRIIIDGACWSCGINHETRPVLDPMEPHQAN